MKKDKERIKAIHDDHLFELLKNLGLYDNILKGLVKCKFCKEVITLENLSAIIPDSGNIGFACDSPKCLRKFNGFLNEK